jgi:PAS domain S-box-containing protein
VESELRQLRLDTGDILANISTGVLTVDGAGRMAYLNPAGEALLGLSAVQWMGAPVVNAVDQMAPGMGMVLRRSIEDAIPITRFKTTTRRNGREIVLAVSTTVLDRSSGEPPSATALFQDISELERLEALNRRAERLEAVAELSASLAHEIKNPLASIRSAVEQIAKPQLGSEDRARLERLVLAESDRLSRLLSEFLDFSDVAMVRRQRLDLAQLVSDALALVRQHPDRREGVEIVLDLPAEPVWVEGDPDLLHRAVFNLALNGVQFTPPHGTVSVRLRRHTPAAGVPPRPVARLVVRDQGPGVAAEDVPRIFDPFYPRRPGGTGLGLAIVHRSLEAHGGAVEVEQAPDGGAEFIVDLPLAQGAPSEEES